MSESEAPRRKPIPRPKGYRCGTRPGPGANGERYGCGQHKVRIGTGNSIAWVCAKCDGLPGVQP